MSVRPTTGDLVVFSSKPQRTGLIIEDDHSGMPFLVELDSGGTMWCRECEVRMQNLYTVCASTTPMNPKGGIEGRMYLIPDVDISKPIPNTGSVYGFSGTDDLKTLLTKPLETFLSYPTNPTKAAAYQYIYYLRGDDIVQMPNAKFKEPQEPFVPHEMLEVGGYYILNEANKVGEAIIPENTILRLATQEDSDYTGKLPYLFEICNTPNSYWVGRVNVTKL